MNPLPPLRRGVELGGVRRNGAGLRPALDPSGITARSAGLRSESASADTPGHRRKRESDPGGCRSGAVIPLGSGLFLIGGPGYRSARPRATRCDPYRDPSLTQCHSS